MSAAGVRASLPPARPLSGHRATGWWGMLCLIGTEGALFTMLLFSYFYLRWHTPTWPPDGIKKPEFSLIVPATVLLLTSSLPVWWAESGIRKGSQMRLRLGFFIAFVEAAAFVGLELYEWTHLGYMPSKDAYASLYFTITGIHLSHVSIAIVMNGYIQLRAWLGHFNQDRRLAVENVSLYWHFVDVVWVAIFTALYISPYFQ